MLAEGWQERHGIRTARNCLRSLTLFYCSAPPLSKYLRVSLCPIVPPQVSLHVAMWCQVRPVDLEYHLSASPTLKELREAVLRASGLYQQLRAQAFETAPSASH